MTARRAEGPAPRGAPPPAGRAQGAARAGMYVHRSNRTEALVEALAGVVARPLADAAAPECIAVQGRGMERWLSMELARRLGVWANPDFPFPRRLVERALAAVLGPDGAPSPCFAPEAMLWAVADLLPALCDRREFAPIRAFLERDERGVKRFQLAERIAATFDEYVVYRHTMVLAWERGAPSAPAWQAMLWRALVERHGSTHVAARAAAFAGAVERCAAPLENFPARISLFGVSTLPPLYLQLLFALSRLVEVHLFVLSPSREYWADTQSKRQQLRALLMQGAGSDAVDDVLHLVEGHPLLASLGRLGRDFQGVLEGTGDYQEPGDDLYADPGTESMLAALQSDILCLRQRGRGDGREPPLSLRPGDESIRVHACHGPMREVEVLHDQLLALFDADPTLEPHDVVVMSPAIDTYAPFIDAVFGGEHAARPRIPYRVADRRPRATDDVADAFGSVLEVLRGRMTAPEVVDLLAADVVRARCGIGTEELERVRAWVADTGIRWGVDAAHRVEVGQPATDANTWRFGLDRLFLGYAMPGEERTLFAEVLPYDDVEGTGSEMLGTLAEFCAALFGFRERLAAPRTLDAWRDDLGEVLETLVARTEENAYQHHRLRRGLAALAERARAGDFGGAVDLDVVRAQLDAEAARGAAAHGFLAGGITFCALVPMRTIPFRVVCLLGMNDGAFPRGRRRLNFDLMAEKPRPGDRSARDDDRYLFLESLLSARARLLITYVGQSITDNSEMPPSVVVSELLDVLGESFAAGAANAPPASAERAPASTARPADAAPAVRAHVVVRHPLQAFSPSYFGAGADPRLFSYARSCCEGARALVGQRDGPRPFLSAPLPLDEAPRVVTLDELAEFFGHPVRAFVRRRLELHLGDDAEVLADREPMELDGLQRWQIGDALLARAMKGEDLSAAFAAVRAAGRLPIGVLGQCVFEEVRHEVAAIAAAAAALTREDRRPVVEVDREIDGTRVVGTLRNVWPAGLVQWQFSKLGARHEVAVWLTHLALNWAAPEGCAPTSHLAGSPADDDGPRLVRFRPVEDPEAVLRELLRLYWLGQTAPLPLFPSASRAYVETWRKDGDDNAALREARKQWGDTYRAGDGADPYVRQVFGERDPLDPEFRLFAGDPEAVPGFADLARAVFGPLLDHREEGA